MDIAAGIFEGVHNKFLLHAGDGFRKARSIGDPPCAAAFGALQGAGQMVGAQHGVIADEYGAFHHVFQFTNIARPAVVLQ